MARALVNKLKKEGIYFPKVSISYDSGRMATSTGEKDGFLMRISTLVRKQNDEGIWYLLPIYREFIQDYETYKLLYQKQLNAFMNDAYMSYLFGEISDIKDIEGYPLYEKDDIQISEEERIKKTM